MPGLVETLLDRSLVASFDRRGFERRARAWTPVPERSLAGSRVLVTGGTAGIGLAAAEALAARGARVEVWGRGRARGEEVARSLGGDFTSVDLGDLSAVGIAATAVQGPLSGVVLNAGAMPLERTLTRQGHELIWASQVLGHLLLLRVLRAQGRLTSASRVVWVSSGGMLAQRLDLDDLTRAHGYQRHGVYANAKRAQVELAAWLAEQWPDVPMASMHPGWVDTEAVALSMPVFRRLTARILRTPHQGADTIVWLLAQASTPPTGRFWFDREPWPEHALPWTGTPPELRDALVRRVLTDTDPWLPAV